ncbi:hypothetical protein E1281_09660 [Actinomadura sp. KC345]|uniref:hypothetical protein n=1 Tax=Actinomadura sp. KC345 TaxID=2530371 RepID=UPI001047C4A6|nr:hypothetical protein [Actinomadura sp. KC345]TDC55959.1 hypothetical protein E1281_09660 [Actinomadura sp. KC345]
MSTRIPAAAGSSPPAAARPPVAPAGQDAVPAAVDRRRWAWLFGLGWLAQVAVRLWLGSGQTVPVATPDESGYLFAARVLTGGPDADMSSGTVYQGGYSLLLTPAFWFGDDPVSVYRGALVINALISAAMLPLAFLLLRRLGVGRGWSYAFAHVAAALPCVLFYSAFVLTDAILPVILAGWLLLAHTWLNAPSPAGPRSPARLHLAGTGASLLAAYAYACHSRGAIMLAVHVALVAAALVCRWRPRRDVFFAVLAVAGGAAAGKMLNDSLLPHMYPYGDNDLGANVAWRITREDGWAWILSIGTGQVWYQAVATGGVAAVGLAAVAFAVLRPASAGSGLPGTSGRTRALALAVIAIVAGIAFATAAALPVEYRIGNYAYGRYLACVTPVLFVIGVAVLLRASRRALLCAAAAAAALILAAACVVQWYAGDLLALYTYTGFDFPETAFLTWDWTAFHLWHATWAGLVLLFASVVFVRLRRHGPLLLAGVLAVVAVGMCVTATNRIARPLVRDATAHTDIRHSIELREQGTVAVDWNIAWTIRLSHYYWAWWSEGDVFDARWYPPPEDADVVVLAWPEDVPATASWRHGAPPGWHIVDSRRTVSGDWVAWAR